MRWLLVLIVVPSLGACVTTAERRRGPQRPVATRCAPGKVLASFTSSRDRVRLRFDRLDRCATDFEEVWIEDTDTRIAKPMQVALAVVAAAVVVIPLFGLRVAQRPDPPPPPMPHYSGPIFVDWLKTLGIMAGGGTAAGLTWFGTDRRLSGGTVEKLETSTRPEVQKEVRVLEGKFATERIALRPLNSAEVALSLEEGAELAESELTLDGAEVELSRAAQPQLAGLRLCQQALERLDPGTPKSLSEPVIERKLSQALGCQRLGWDFADQVITTMTAFPLR